MKPIKGIVTSVLDGLHIKTESGSLMHWPHRVGKIGTKVLIFYDFTRRRIRDIVAVKDYSFVDGLEETKTDEEDMEIDHSQLLDTDIERRVNNT